MFVVVIMVNKQKYGPFGEYENALQFALARWKGYEFVIHGSSMETYYTNGLPVDL